MKSLVVIVVLAFVAPVSAVVAANELLPQGVVEMRSLAKRLMYDGQYGEAINTYQTIADATANNARSHYDLAAAMSFIQMYAGALVPLQHARLLQPDNGKFHALAALIHLQLHQPQQALSASVAGAKLGDTRAMFTLVEMYHEGRGTVPDPRVALAWLQRAARGGHLGALDMLVGLYTRGGSGPDALPVTPDPTLAASWQQQLTKAEAALEQRWLGVGSRAPIPHD